MDVIKLLRVDHRLIHGQVAFSWTKFLDADLILVANDKIEGDPLRMNLLRMAKPGGVKLVMKSIEKSAEAINGGQTDKYKMFIVVETIDDAYRLVKLVPSITAINLGGTKSAPEKKSIAKAVSVSEAETEQLQELVGKGISVYTQLVPDDVQQAFEKLI